MKKYLDSLSRMQLMYTITSLIFATGLFTLLSITHTELKNTRGQFASSTNSFTQKVTELESQITDLNEKNMTLESFLTEEQQQKADLEADKRRNERTIDKLEKLTTYDPELLKKYSKVYFLSENYSPPKLVDIAEEFKIKADKKLQFLEEAYPFLERLLNEAHEDGVDLRVISAYRSFDEQMALKSNYAVTYGAGTANQFSADQGYSEHQLGTTVDFGTPEVPGAYLSFEKTDAFRWLMDNAHTYGFVLSYPKGNTYYTYEPWHWRFVGDKLARDIHEASKYFYEMDQRDIDDYLIHLFD
jgi:D-alanyl-D-alanine carboxypeptidase